MDATIETLSAMTEQMIEVHFIQRESLVQHMRALNEMYLADGLGSQERLV